MPDVQVKRGEAARQQPAVAVSERDREALEALRPFMAPLPPTATMLILEAIAQARAEEREACEEIAQGVEARCLATDLAAAACARIKAAIRARGEK